MLAEAAGKDSGGTVVPLGQRPKFPAALGRRAGAGWRTGTRNGHCSRLGGRSGSAAGSGSGSGHPPADAIRAGARDPSASPEDLQKELVETDPNTRLNLQQLLGSLAAKATTRAGRHAAADEGGRAHGDPLRPGALSRRAKSR